MSYTIVTGAAGFIGSRLVAGLNRRGIKEIIAVDNLEDGSKVSNLARLEIADYLDMRDFRSRLGRGDFDDGIDVLLHQGANTNTMEYDGRLMMEENYEYSKALLDWCAEEEVPMIYASSASVYGAGRKFAEALENENPLNVYAYSKFLFDQYVGKHAGRFAAQVAGLRYFNVYGPNEAHKKKTKMHSIALQAFEQYGAEARVTLFAGSHGYDDGEQRRDFIHVDDAVAVNLWLLEHRGVSGIFNCGTGRAQSFNAVAAAVINGVDGTRHSVQELVERKLIQYVPFPPTLLDKYQAFTEADLSKLRAAGYPGEFMNVEQGVAAYVKELRGK